MTAEDLSQPVLYTRQDMNAAMLHDFAAGEVGVFTTRCPGKDSDSEDAAALIPFQEGQGVIVIADGVGGHSGGALAAGLAVQAMNDSILQAKQDEHTLRDAILNGFEDANRAVTAIGTGAGTTLTAVEINEAAIRPYHVGDSMILLIGQRGKMRLQTISHSPVGYAVESGMLEEEEAMHHEDRHIVSNMVGVPDMRIEIGWMISMQKRDTLVVASDGLFDNLHVEEIVECARKGPLKKVMESLAEKTLGRMRHENDGQPSKPDDLTFVAYRRGGRGRNR